MRALRRQMSWVAVGVALAVTSGAAIAEVGGKMSFFVSSVGLGKGGNLGGLEGADAHCQALAKAAGAGNRTWHAYLSTQGANLTDAKVVNARDRIGTGPWYNAKGVMIAKDVDDLHSPANRISKETALDEKGQPIKGRGDTPNQHDILTGSRVDGSAFPGSPFPDMTCSNWTNGGMEGAAMVGHHDRIGPIDHAWARSWNSAHPTRGCHTNGIKSTGGDAMLYCFAVK